MAEIWNWEWGLVGILGLPHFPTVFSRNLQFARVSCPALLVFYPSAAYRCPGNSQQEQSLATHQTTNPALFQIPFRSTCTFVSAMANSQSVILLVCLASYISLSICFPCLQQEGITTTPLLTVVAGDSSAVLRLQGMMWTLYPTVLDTNNVVQVLEQASVTVAFNGLQEIGTINGGHFNPLVGGTPFPESPFLFPIYSSVFFKDMNCTYSQRLDYRGGAVVVNITTISAAHPAYPQFSFVSNLATTTQTFSEIDYVDKLTNQSVNATYLYVLAEAQNRPIFSVLTLYIILHPH